MASSTSSVDEWRKSVDKTLKYYKGKINKLKASNKSRVLRMQTSWHREKRVLSNKIGALQTKNQVLQQEKQVLQQEIRYLGKKLKTAISISDPEEKDDETTEEEAENDPIHIHKIFDYNSSHQLQMHKEKSINHITTNKHSLRLAKWMKNTQKLMNGYQAFKSCESYALSQYSDYKQLMTEQEAKMEDVSNYVSDLIAQKRKIKSLFEKYDNEMTKKNEMYKESFMECEKAREKRKDLYQKLLQSVDRLNDAIDDENELNQRKSTLYYEYNALRDELKQCKNELNNCSQLIKEYHQFDKLNDETISEMQKYFKTQWDIFMASWLEWDHQLIICYIKYLIAENQLVLSKKINLNEIEMGMKQHGMNGACFQRIDTIKSQLKSVGFDVLNDRQQIYEKIKELIVRQREREYAVYAKYADEGQCNASDTYTSHTKDDIDHGIPVEFLCPITKKVMMQPVHAFDDYTYEKHAIIAYLNKYNRSPITDENCDDNDFMLLPNRKLAQKIQTFLYINPQITVSIKTTK